MCVAHTMGDKMWWQKHRRGDDDGTQIYKIKHARTHWNVDIDMIPTVERKEKPMSKCSYT